MLDKYGEELFLRSGLHFAVHLSGKDEDMVSQGTLPSGGKLLINKLAAQADLLVAEGFIEPHFFAGFSGGRKSVLPESPAGPPYWPTTAPLSLTASLPAPASWTATPFTGI